MSDYNYLLALIYELNELRSCFYIMLILSDHLLQLTFNKLVTADRVSVLIYNQPHPKASQENALKREWTSLFF